MTSEIDSAHRVLRPEAASLEAAWHALVTAEKEQVEGLPNRPRPDDFYGPIATAFVDDPRRTNEPLLDAILALARPSETWMDLGAGGGRYALPIALHTEAVYAVEPSDGMRQVLAESAAHHGIENVEVFAERWPCESAAPEADVCFICHVGYDIADIGPFLDQMEAHARRLCVAVMFERPPLSEWAPLWRDVHGEERVLLPAMPELVTLLYARGRYPAVRLLDRPPRPQQDIDALHRSVRRPVWVLEGTEEDTKVAKAVRAHAIATQDGGFMLKSRPSRIGLITWEPR